MVLDIVLGVLFAAAALYGLFKGLVRIGIGVAGLAITLALALRFAGTLSESFAGVFASPQVARAAAFVAIVVVGLLLTALVAWLARKLVAGAQIGWLDRLAGGVVALAGAMLFAGAMLVALTLFVGAPAVERSYVAAVTMRVADAAALVLPSPMADTYHERRHAAQRNQR
ncbi:MAG: CvpA family protein [Acidobacteria bacterium]|nr:CvpA family protein [Acidobacteriota bacterium]